MPHSFGYRARTRDMFKRKFGGALYCYVNGGTKVLKICAIYIEKGMIKLSTYLIPYRVGDIVDIKANAAQQRGMPHKYYHG